MKHIFLTALFAAALTSSAATPSAQSFTTIGRGMARGMSSDGRYAVGTDASNPYRSYLWDSEIGVQEWLTDFDMEAQEDPEGRSGMFSAVNKDGVIVGAIKDKDMMMYWDDGWDAFVQPLSTAAMWRDGELIKLGCGGMAVTDFLDLEDGSWAVDLTEDAKKVVGYIMRGNTAYYTPVGWEYNDQTGEWDFSKYALIEGMDNGEIGAISADGSIAVGYAKKGMLALPVYWTSPETCIQIQLTPEDAAVYTTDFNLNYAYDVSPNGEYILFTLNNIVPCVYSVKEKTYRKLTLNGDAGRLYVRSVADNGDTAGTFVYGNFFTGTTNVAFWYSYESDVFTTFDYFTQTYAPELTDLPSFSTSEIKTISADGSKYYGNTGSSVWVLTTDPERRSIPRAIRNLAAVNDNVGEILITWDPSDKIPADLTLLNYEVYVNGEKKATVAAGEPLESRVTDLAEGIYGVEIEQEFATAGGGTMMSPLSDKESVKVMSYFGFPFFDDFESSNLHTEGWTAELKKGNIFHDLKWQYRSTGEEYNASSTLNTIIDTDEPYETVVSTRYIDATSLSDVYVSFAKKMSYANRDDWYLKNDFLTLEISYDGKEWQRVKDYCADDVEAGPWIYEKIDISALAKGKKFKLRLNAHGTSDAHLLWYIDNFKVGNDDKTDAPQGLMAIEKEGEITLTWKNTIDAYQVCYHENSPILYEVSFGDSEGAPLIAASAYDAEMMKPFVGKYISSVTTFLYDNPWFDADKPTHASILIYADDELVCEQEIQEIDNGFTFTVKLDKAVPVEPGKEYKVGMKIFDYSPSQQPVYYQVTDQFVQWKSDLYSEDNGKTWKSLYDYYKDQPDMEDWGMCVWPMRVNITDDEEVYDNYILDDTLDGYMVYHNGEAVNDKLIYPAHMKYILPDAEDGATYEVAAFYRSGDVSENSDPVTVRKSGVEGIRQDSDASFSRDGDKILLPDGTQSAALYDLTGNEVAATAGRTLTVKGIDDGVYVLKVDKNGKSVSRRVLIRK